MSYAIVFLLSFLIICAVSVALTKNLLHAVLIQMGYSTIMAVIWLLLESPDLAITEAAVGAYSLTLSVRPQESIHKGTHYRNHTACGSLETRNPMLLEIMNMISNSNPFKKTNIYSLLSV